MAANYFEAFGNQFKGYISTFSTDTSAALIDNLGGVVAVGLVMFIIVRSFMMMRENNYYLRHYRPDAQNRIYCLPGIKHRPLYQLRSQGP
jgi:hypothetical protein